MKIIIAGSRSVRDYDLLVSAIRKSVFAITEVVSGHARGADKLGERWATENGVPVKIFAAAWKNLDAPGAIIKTGVHGQYNAKAGLDRNGLMATYADGAIILWDGKSRGTKHMIDMMTKMHKPIEVIKI